MANPPYVINNYGRKAPMSSFLPGVAGPHGIPLWCFYVNRGQCIAGFGSRDKNHSIMEFSPAHTAYQRVQTMGMRTFVQADGSVCEPFADGSGSMHVTENGLSIRWEANGLRAEADYFIIPNASMGALCRTLRLTNTSECEKQLAVLDGLAAIVPFGLNQFDLKMMGQTAKAWMMVESVCERMPYFRLRSSLVDTTSVAAIEDGSFAACEMEGRLLPVIVDPAVVFEWDTSFADPKALHHRHISSLVCAEQRMQNELPCCFFAAEKTLAPQANMELTSLYGLSHGREALASFVKQMLLEGGIGSRRTEAQTLLDPYVHLIDTHTADPLFDSYCRQSFIDNFLRGGVPHLFRHGQDTQLFYLYSRKHGDLERDYNDFVVTPEYASQGNGNFRDVLQNRRSDPRFCPEAGWRPLKPFLELIQSDGYNPLVIQPVTFTVDDPSICPEIAPVLSAPFTPGDVMMALEKTSITQKQQKDTIGRILCSANANVNASFGEGYWVDHWIYLLDLLESYLGVFPENKTELLSQRCLRWYESRALVRPLHERCVTAGSELRQHNALNEEAKRGCARSWLCYADGREVLSTAMEKMFMLCVLKFASLDASGEAISMEAGKPGWYDALNGLPGLFGSSTAESCELWRTLRFITGALQEYGQDLKLPQEMVALARNMAQVAHCADAVQRWQQATALLEAYRSQTAHGMEDECTLSAGEAAKVAQALESCVASAVNALIARPGVMPTYFTNLPKTWYCDDAGIHPTAFDHTALPPFLEGPMHAMRLPLSREKKRAILDSVRKSVLYDQKLRMFKVSADLSAETPELGRANAFTRGWLEHESIWLHMEYKYILEMLKNGFYEDFFSAFSDALIPFQPPERYGRSVLENSSFLASSSNPDPSTHGRGFVARLSGATAEFLDMWQTMFFGMTPFRQSSEGVLLQLSPTLPARLIPRDGQVSAMFLGHTPVIYQFEASENVTPETHGVHAYVLTDAEGVEHVMAGPVLGSKVAQKVRSGEYTSIRAVVRHR